MKVPPIGIPREAVQKTCHPERSDGRAVAKSKHLLTLISLLSVTLAACAPRQTLRTTPSGLQDRVLAAGTGEVAISGQRVSGG